MSENWCSLLSNWSMETSLQSCSSPIDKKNLQNHFNCYFHKFPWDVEIIFEDLETMVSFFLFGNYVLEEVCNKLIEYNQDSRASVAHVKFISWIKGQPFATCFTSEKEENVTLIKYLRYRLKLKSVFFLHVIQKESILKLDIRNIIMASRQK